MRKIISIVVLIMILASITTISMATDVTFSLDSEEQAKVESEIKISIIANNFTRAGDNKAIEWKNVYDSEKLEYKEVSGKNNWNIQVSTDKTGFTATKQGVVSEEEVIAEITYVVKENAELGKTTFSIEEILTSADGDEVEAIDAQIELEILEKEEANTEEKRLTDIKISKKPSKTTYKEGEKFDKTGMEITATYSDGTSKKIEGFTYSPNRELKITDTKIIISYTEEGITKTVEQTIEVIANGDISNDDEEGTTPGDDENGDVSNDDETGDAPSDDENGDVPNNEETGDVPSDDENGDVPNDDETGDTPSDDTVADKEYPYTGEEKFIISVMCISIVCIISYVGYRKYKNI